MAANVDLRLDVVTTWRLPERLAAELPKIPTEIVSKVARQLRYGKGGIAEQFRRQGAITRSGFTKWKPSKRALREGGPTLIKTGAYFRAWLGRGPGGVARVVQSGNAQAIEVGVDRALFPRVHVFQKDRPTTFRRGGSSWQVAQRPVRLNNPVVTEARQIFVAGIQDHIKGLGG